MQVKKKDKFELLESLEAKYLQSDRNIRTEALGRLKEGVRDCFLSMPIGQSWEGTREELKRCFSDLTSQGHVVVHLENMCKNQKKHCISLYRNSKMPYGATGKLLGTI